MGVANDRSIAWTAAEAASRAGARLGFTYQNHAMARRVVPLAESVGAEITVPCDVADGDEIDRHSIPLRALEKYRFCGPCYCFLRPK
ncbi:MAG: hypothetical protein CM1200mP4_4470 [Rhodospirillaceae bacterium]|nr:MAG: hypothetical protein CM1200mP4_4470 [Rhodospirillaceae bacterium]